MNSKMTTNSQLSTTESKKTKTKQTAKTEMELQKWRSHGGLSTGEWEGKRRGKGTKKQHKLQVENRQGEGKNSVGNVEAKEFICMAHGHELKGGNVGRRGVQGGGE